MGQLTAVTFTDSQGNAQALGFAYDALGQLLCEQSSAGNLQHHYDELGNLIGKLDQQSAAQHRQLLHYDATGRIIASQDSLHGQRETFAYDAEHRLIEVRSQKDGRETVVKMTYDPLGRRIAKTEHDNNGYPLGETRFDWEGLRLLQEHRHSQTSLYIYEEDSYAPLARVDGTGEHQSVRYYHNDLNGLPEQLTEADGKTVWQARYRVWGNTVEEVREPYFIEEQNLRFQGQYLDREIGLHYNTFRFYDPDVGRFTTPDPIGLAGGINLYQYSPNPITWIDPLGWAPAKPGDIIDYGKSAPGFEKHHGILDAWSKHNIKDYVSRNGQTPTVVMTVDQHNATKEVAKDWVQKKTGKRGFKGFDWKKVSKFEILRLSNKMFKAAEAKGFPKASRGLYNKAMKNYLRKGCGR